MRRAVDEPAAGLALAAVAFTAVFFTGLRAGLAGFGLAFAVVAALWAGALRAGAALTAGLAAGLEERARWLSPMAHSASLRLAGLLP